MRDNAVVDRNHAFVHDDVIYSERTPGYFAWALENDDRCEPRGFRLSAAGGGPAVKAVFYSPTAVAVSPAGGLLVADGGDNRLGRYRPSPQHAQAGDRA